MDFNENLIPFFVATAKTGGGKCGVAPNVEKVKILEMIIIFYVIIEMFHLTKLH